MSRSTTILCLRAFRQGPATSALLHGQRRVAPTRRGATRLLPALVLFCAFAAPAFAAGGFPMPSICDRDCWEARAPQGTISQMSGLTRAVIHHTASSTDYYVTSLEESAARVRAVQNYHMDVNGWSDIGYHFLADTLGNGFEGREGSIDSLPRGAHDGINDQSFGVSLMGYFHEPYNQEPTVENRCAAYKIIAWRIPDPFTGYGAGTYGGIPSVGYIAGHRDVSATACPGDLLYGPYIGTDPYGGEARDTVRQLITSGESPLCGGGGVVCCPTAPTLSRVLNVGNDSSLVVEWNDLGAVLGYNLYYSEDGVNFGPPVALETGVTRYVDTGLRTGVTRYYKVTAVGSSYEGKPSDVYGARAGMGTSPVLVVDGNDRWTTQTENPGADNHAFATLAGEALGDTGFDTVDNKVIEDGLVSLSDYDAVIWLLGEESTTSSTFSPAEQSAVAEYLGAGGKLFVSGAEIGWDLVEKGSSADVAFYTTWFKADFGVDDADTYLASPVSGGIFEPVGPIDFSAGVMDVAYPDSMSPIDGAVSELLYENSGAGLIAAIRYDGSYQLVYFGFPFEAIASAETRTAVMNQVLGFFWPSSEMFVEEVALSLEAPARRKALAEVTILDDGGRPVAGATVSGTFVGRFSGTVSALTDSSGLASLEADVLDRSEAHFTFCVEAVEHSTLVYNPADNEVTCRKH